MRGSIHRIYYTQKLHLRMYTPIRAEELILMRGLDYLNYQDTNAWRKITILYGVTVK